MRRANATGTAAFDVYEHVCLELCEASEADAARAVLDAPPLNELAKEDPERRAHHLSASNYELIRAAAATALTPHDELNQPAVAVFEPGSFELSEASRDYLDLLAHTLRPRL